MYLAGYCICIVFVHALRANFTASRTLPIQSGRGSDLNGAKVPHSLHLPTMPNNINQGVQQCEEEVKVECSSSLTRTLFRTVNGELAKQINVKQDVQL